MVRPVTNQRVGLANHRLLAVLLWLSALAVSDVQGQSTSTAASTSPKASTSSTTTTTASVVNGSVVSGSSVSAGAGNVVAGSTTTVATSADMIAGLHSRLSDKSMSCGNAMLSGKDVISVECEIKNPNASYSIVQSAPYFQWGKNQTCKMNFTGCTQKQDKPCSCEKAADSAYNTMIKLKASELTTMDKIYCVWPAKDTPGDSAKFLKVSINVGVVKDKCDRSKAVQVEAACSTLVWLAVTHLLLGLYYPN